MANSYEMDMCNGPIVKKMLAFTIPLMFSSILQLLFNAADIIVVGNFVGDNAIAAVGANTAIIALLTNLFTGLAIGANVVAAKCFGAKKDEELKNTVQTSMLLSIFSGIILTVVGVAGARVILVMMETSVEYLDQAVIYLRIYFGGITAMMVYNFGSALLRAVGDTKRPLYYLFAAGVINVALNLVFVLVFKMGVAGVALATIISETVSAALVVRCLITEQGAIRLVLKNIKFDMGKFAAITRVGLPAGFQGVVFALSNVVIQSSVNLFGATVVAGNTAASNIEGFVYFGMNSFYQTTISFTSQNYGARKYGRINKIVLTGEVCAIIVGIVMGGSALLFGRNLLGIYSKSPAVIEAGMTRMVIIMTTYYLCGMMDVMVGGLRGIGYSVLPMVVSMIGACGLRLVWIATVFQIDRLHTVDTIYISYPITWFITFSVHLVCFIVLKRKLDKKVKQDKSDQSAVSDLRAN